MRWSERAGWVVFGLAAIFAAFALTVRPVGYDVGAYLIAARALVEGRPLYLPAGAPLVLDFGVFLYPPPVAALFVPLLALPPVVAVWTVVAALVGLAAALGTVLVAPLTRPIRPWAAAALVLFFPLLLELSVGNLNLVTLALVLLAWSWRDHPVRGGAVLALAIGLKLVAIAILLYYMGSGRWRQLGWAAVVGGAVIVVSLPLLAPAWHDHAALILRSLTQEIRSEAIDVRPEPLRGPLAHLGLLAAGSVTALGSGVLARRAPERATELHHVALAAAPLLAPAIWYTYLLFALPLLAAEVRTLASRPILLALPAMAWLAMEAPLGLEVWRFAGLAAATLLGIALYARAAWLAPRVPQAAAVP